MQERSIANSVRGRFASALVLSLLFMASSWVTAVSDAELENGVKFNSSSDVQMNLYTMYIALKTPLLGVMDSSLPRFRSQGAKSQ